MFCLPWLEVAAYAYERVHNSFYTARLSWYESEKFTTISPRILTIDLSGRKEKHFTNGAGSFLI